LKALILVLTTVLFSSTATLAQNTQTTEVEEIVRDISAAYTSLNGKTITLRGAIGTLFGDSIYFANANGRFEVQFDAGRTARKKIANCELNMFDWQRSDCTVEVDAEILIKEPFSFAEGTEVTLIVYEVRE